MRGAISFFQGLHHVLVGRPGFRLYMFHTGNVPDFVAILVKQSNQIVCDIFPIHRSDVAVVGINLKIIRMGSYARVAEEFPSFIIKSELLTDFPFSINIKSEFSTFVLIRAGFDLFFKFRSPWNIQLEAGYIQLVRPGLGR